MDKCPEHQMYVSEVTPCPGCLQDAEEWLAEQAEREQKRQLHHVSRRLRRIERGQSWGTTLLYLLFFFLVVLPLLK